MAVRIRKSVWSLPPGDPSLDWFRKAVDALIQRPASNPSSWRYLAAVHGVPGGMTVPPGAAQFWDQCQHQSWFFPPWHRGYLVALEAQLREDIVQHGGPSTWALPYWDYFGPSDEFDIPPAFAQQKMPDGSPNPLFVTARYGPNANNIVFVPTQAGLKKHPVPPPNYMGTVTETCLSNTVYTGFRPQHAADGFLARR